MRKVMTRTQSRPLRLAPAATVAPTPAPLTPADDASRVPGAVPPRPAGRWRRTVHGVRRPPTGLAGQVDADP
ncbi:hypothetical protein R2F25_22680 [Streptomyces sp. UP1A-1]|nr:hypothetical protein [Streptomyces sp. UP1A-1]